MDLFVFSHDGKLETNNCVIMLVVRYRCGMCCMHQGIMQISVINPTTLLLFYAVLGGPLIQNKVESKGRLLGMTLDLNHDDKRYTFLPLGSLKERLEHFQILKYVLCAFSIYARYFTFVSNPLLFYATPP